MPNVYIVRPADHDSEEWVRCHECLKGHTHSLCETRERVLCVCVCVSEREREREGGTGVRNA